MLRALALVMIVPVAVFAQSSSAARRGVEGDLLVSRAFPATRIRVAAPFRYVGSHPFLLGEIARGDRYVFLDADGKRVKRLFVAQFEEILPTSDEIYRYRFDDALELGGHRYRHGTFAFSARASVAENATGELARTLEFLRARGYTLDDELMSSRFVTLGGDRKHELILFYMETVPGAGHRLADLVSDDAGTPLWREVAVALTERSMRAFTVLD
jgi:hypothetical protein